MSSTEPQLVRNPEWFETSARVWWMGAESYAQFQARIEKEDKEDADYLALNIWSNSQQKWIPRQPGQQGVRCE